MGCLRFGGALYTARFLEKEARGCFGRLAVPGPSTPRPAEVRIGGGP